MKIAVRAILFFFLAVGAYAVDSTWLIVSIPEICIFQIPPTVEIQKGAYKRFNTQFRKTIFEIETSVERVVAQQKGINALDPLALKRYCRIIVETARDAKGTYAKIDEPLVVSPAELKELDKELKRQTHQVASLYASKGMKMSILSWQPVQIICVNKMAAVLTTYTRSIDGAPSVLVRTYRIQNNDCLHMITISYRESEKAIWAADLNKVIETFQFKKRGNNNSDVSFDGIKSSLRKHMILLIGVISGFFCFFLLTFELYMKKTLREGGGNRKNGVFLFLFSLLFFLFAWNVLPQKTIKDNFIPVGLAFLGVYFGVFQMATGKSIFSVQKEISEKNLSVKIAVSLAIFTPFILSLIAFVGWVFFREGLFGSPKSPNVITTFISAPDNHTLLSEKQPKAEENDKTSLPPEIKPPTILSFPPKTLYEDQSKSLRVTDVTFWSSRSEAQIVVNLSGVPKVAPVSALSDGTYFFDISDCIFPPGKKRFNVHHSFLNKALVVKEVKNKKTRISFSLPAGIHQRTFYLPKKSDKPDRIVVFLSHQEEHSKHVDKNK